MPDFDINEFFDAHEFHLAKLKQDQSYGNLGHETWQQNIIRLEKAIIYLLEKQEREDLR